MSVPKFLTNLDLSLNQILGVVIENLTANPGGGGAAEGRIIYRTDTHKLEVCANGAVWRIVLTDDVTLDQIAVAAANVNLNSKKITNLLDPTAAQDAATKAYVDNAIAGLSPKDSVRAATTVNVNLTGTQTIDGIALIAGDRVLVKNQTTSTENGIYVVAAGAWARATDSDTAVELEAAATWVEEGTTQGHTLWTQTAVNFVLGTDPVAWAQFGGGTSYTAGAGLALAGVDFSVNVDGTGIEINADTLRLKDLGVTGAKLATGAVDLAGTKITGTLVLANGGTGGTTAATARASLGATTKFAADITGDAATTSFAVTHNLNTKDVIVQLYEATTDAMVIADVVRTSVNVATVSFAVAPANLKVYRLVVVA